MREEKLVFVYNADNDLFSSVADMAHKIFSPTTYQCHLCTLTYGNFYIKKEWKDFIDSFPVECQFIYKNQFLKEYKLMFDLPAVLLQSKSGIKEIISKSQLQSCETLEELKKLVSEKLTKNK